MKKRLIVRLTLLALASSLSVSAQAATPPVPDAGQTLRELTPLSISGQKFTVISIQK